MQDLFLSLSKDPDRDIRKSSDEGADALAYEAAFQAVLATSQFRELKAVAVAFKYPEAINAARDSQEVLLVDDLVRAAGRYLVSRLVAQKLVGQQEDDPLEAFIALRKFLAVEQLLEELGSGGSAGGFIDDLSKECRARILELPENEQVPVREYLKDYLMNQWLYPWAETEAGRQLGVTYGVLFDEARVPRGEIGVLEKDVLKRVMAGVNLDGELGELVERVVALIERTVAEYGLEPMSDILSEGATALPNLPPEVGVIPGEGGDQCRRILVGIATNKRPSAKFGAKSVIRKVRDAMIKCCDSGTEPNTEIVIFVGHLDAIPGVLDESMLDLEGHLRRGTLKAFIPIGVLRNRPNFLSWR